MLGIPVGLEARDVGELEHRVRMQEAGLRGGLVILGADGQQHAAPAKRQAVLLEGGVGLGLRGFAANEDSIRAVVSDDAAPESVVEVQHQHLAAAAE